MAETEKLNIEDLEESTFEDEDLEKVAGGKWSFNALTLEERSEYLKLKKAYENSFKFGNQSTQHDEALANINAFAERMEEKYGE